MSAWILSAHRTGRDVSPHLCRSPCKLRKASLYQSSSPGLEDDACEWVWPCSTPLTTSTPVRCKITSPARDWASFSTAKACPCAANLNSISRCEDLHPGRYCSLLLS